MKKILIRSPKKNIVISFSGGETSAKMLLDILEMNKSKDLSDKFNIYIPFMNTGEEREETLLFVHRVDMWIRDNYGYRVTWLQYDGYDCQEKKHKTKIVSYETAYRSHDKDQIANLWADHPFRKMIQYFGIPNTKYKHCSRELKAYVCRRWMKEYNGLTERSYTVATGIRADEIDRLTQNRWHPLAINGVVKININTFWSKMPFRLNLKGYEGNCKTCHKKSKRKLCTIARHEPHHFSFFEQMEKEFSLYSPLRCGGKSRRKQVLGSVSFFRENRTVKDIFAESMQDFDDSEDDSVIYEEVLDSSPDCSESCEPF